MAKIRGTVRHSDLEGGVWELHTEGGEVYQLDGADDTLRQDGAKVEVEGTVERGMMSIGMCGSVLKVRRARRV